MVLIHPVVDLILGATLGFAVYFTATDSWWKVPTLIRRLRDLV